jgi:transposase
VILEAWRMMQRRQARRGDLSTEQRTSLASITRTNTTLYRAYLLKEQLREVFRVKGRVGRQLLAGWLSWASHSRIPEFVALARTIRRYRDLVWNTLDHNMSNARSEATNTHLRALTKRPDRHGHAHPRRSLPRATKPEMTHYNVSRSKFRTADAAPFPMR